MEQVRGLLWLLLITYLAGGSISLLGGGVLDLSSPLTSAVPLVIGANAQLMMSSPGVASQLTVPSLTNLGGAVSLPASGAVIASNQASLVITGTLLQQAGVLSPSSSVLSANKISVAGGALQGSGTVFGSVFTSGAGAITPSTLLNISGSLNHTGTLDVTLTQPSPPLLSGKPVVTQQAVLTGGF